MSLSYDAPCPERKKGRRRKRKPMRRRKRSERYVHPKKKNPLSYVTPTGVTRSCTLPPSLTSTRDLRACSKSRFPARRSLCAALLLAVSTSLQLIVLRYLLCPSRPLYWYSFFRALFTYPFLPSCSSFVSASLRIAATCLKYRE